MNKKTNLWQRVADVMKKYLQNEQCNNFRCNAAQEALCKQAVQRY
jgi:hypothetical protein